ncbi:MAG: DUF2383 domain-containing protein [Pseudohongiella sp.]
MSILRSQQQVALQELYRLAQESADHYRDSAEFVDNEAAAQLLNHIASERDQLAQQLAQAIRDTGDLPAAPNADREAGEQLIHRLHTWFTADQTRDVLEQRLKAEQALANILRENKDAENADDYQRLHEHFISQVENVTQKLAQAMA